MAQFEKAANAEDYRGAAKQFELAAQSAPWYAEAYYNLGAAYGKAEDYEKEKQSLRALASLKQNPSDKALLEKIVRQASSFNPPLPVPEETERYLARGKAAFDDAKEPGDYKDAVGQFQHAREAAPWFGPVYYSLGVAQSTAGDYKAAKESLSLYLVWEHDPAVLKAARDLIYQADYKQEKAQAEQAKRDAEAEAERRKLRAKQALLAGLNGNWNCKQGCGGTATVQLSQGSFSLSWGQWGLKGTLNEFAVEGLFTQPGFYQTETTCNIPGSTHNFSGTVSEDGKTITIHTEVNNYVGHWQKPAGLFAVKSCTDIVLSSVEPFIITVSR
jgi:tetratricopeptide (TPR) repeat protein